MLTRMKSFFLFTGFTALMTLLPGCLDIYFTTEIKPNGDLIKTVVLEGDSTEILETFIPMIKNETWEREWLAGEDDKSKLVLTKTFTNDRDALADLNPADSAPTLRIVPDLKKQFRWFFTYFKYKETILATNPFNKLDWRDYLTPDEIGLAVMDEDEREKDPRYNAEEYKSVEKRFEEYLLNSAFEEFYGLFVKALSQTQNITLTADHLSRQKSIIFKTAVDSDQNDTVEDLINIFCAALESEDPKTIYAQNTDLLNWFDLKLEYFSNAFDDNLRFTIRMPGLLLDSNSNEIQGNNLSWNIDGFDDTFLTDYEMTAESRIVNNWAFVVTGVLLAILVFLLVYLIWKKKK